MAAERRRPRRVPVTTGDERAGRALSSATQLLVRQLGDAFRTVYQAVDEVQRRTVDLTLDVMTLEAFKPRWIGATVRTTTDQCADALRVFASVRGLQLGYRELVNKTEVFNLVRHARRFIGADVRATDETVAQLVGVAYSLPPFLRIWAIEGLGHDYADWAREQGEPARLLAADSALPDGALTMLHAGLGLSAADARLREATEFDADETFRKTVRQFRDECDRSARRGYAGCAYESLGLVTRAFHPALMTAVDRALADAQAELRPYFWHGVGRALYFSPLEFVPGVSSPWIRIDADATDDAARLNATAGLAWATALVNMRQPEIVGALLPNVVTSSRDAIADGVASAFAMALDTDLSNPFVPAFCGYVPSDPISKRVWCATIPSIEAVDRIRRAAKEQTALERLFMYAPLAGAGSQECTA